MGISLTHENLALHSLASLNSQVKLTQGLILAHFRSQRHCCDHIFPAMRLTSKFRKLSMLSDVPLPTKYMRIPIKTKWQIC